MADKNIDLGRLVIRAFNIKAVTWGDDNIVMPSGEMTISKKVLPDIISDMDAV